MTREEFDKRFADLRSREFGCFVVRCACGVEHAIYEGLVDWLFRTCIEPCYVCKGTEKTLDVGVGAEYEL